MQVADHEKLNPAEGLLTAAMAAEHGIHCIEQVGPDHAYFINYQQIKTPDNLLFFLTESKLALFIRTPGSCSRQKRAEGQLKEGMQGDSAGIDGSDSGGSGDDQSFGGFFLQVVKKGGFAGACLAGQENITAGGFNKIIRQLQFRTKFHLQGQRVSCLPLLPLKKLPMIY